MPLFRSSKVLETQIDDFLDTVAEGGLVFREGVNAYLSGNTEDFAATITKIDRI